MFPDLNNETFIVIEQLVNGSCYVRELAEKTGLAASTVFRILEKLEKENLLEFKNVKNKKIVSLNLGSFLARRLVSFLYLYKIINSKSFKTLKNKSVSIHAYGSVVDGNMDAFSDIDLWVMTEKKIPLLGQGKIRNSFSNELGLEVSIKFYTKQGFDSLKEQDSIFFNELQYGGLLLWRKKNGKG